MPIAYTLSQYGLIVTDDEGNIIWEYPIEGLRLYGLDVDPRTGNFYTTTHQEILEISRTAGIVWRYSNPRCLSLHSIQYTGSGLLVSSAQFDCAMEINKQEGVIWEWHGKNHYTPPKGYAYRDDKREWTGDEPEWLHLNHAWRLPNGNTVLSLYYDPRDLLPEEYPPNNGPTGMFLEVDEAGNILWEWGRGITHHQHYILPYNDGYIACDNGNNRVIMFKPDKGIIWSIKTPYQPHALDILPDGDLLVTYPQKYRIARITPDEEKMVYTVPERLQTPETRLFVAVYLPSWDVEYTEKEKKILMERLRRLGYVG